MGEKVERSLEGWANQGLLCLHCCRRVASSQINRNVHGFLSKGAIEIPFWSVLLLQGKESIQLNRGELLVVVFFLK